MSSKSTEEFNCPSPFESYSGENTVRHVECNTGLRCLRCGRDTMNQRYYILNGGGSADVNIYQSWCPCGYQDETSGLNTSDYCY